MKRILLILTFTLITMTISEQSVIRQDKFCIPFQEENCKPIYNVDATVYWPVKAQTDSSPLITADNSKIDLDKLKKGKLRWIAVSRNLLKRWNGDLDYGDEVIVTSNNPEINGKWVIKDTMASRFENRIDFLSHKKGIYGKWKNVNITKVT